MSNLVSTASLSIDRVIDRVRICYFAGVLLSIKTWRSIRSIPLRVFLWFPDVSLSQSDELPLTNYPICRRRGKERLGQPSLVFCIVRGYVSGSAWLLPHHQP